MPDRRLYPSAGTPADGGDRRGGTVALDGSNPTTVATGLVTIDHAQVSFNASAAPGLDPALVTCTFSGGTLSIYAWKVTGAGDTTLVASTSTDTVNWFAVGI